MFWGYMNFNPASNSLWLLTKVHPLWQMRPQASIVSARITFLRDMDVVSHYSIIAFSWFVLTHCLESHITYPSCSNYIKGQQMITSSHWFAEFMPKLLQSGTKNWPNKTSSFVFGFSIRATEIKRYRLTALDRLLPLWCKCPNSFGVTNWRKCVAPFELPCKAPFCLAATQRF